MGIRNHVWNAVQWKVMKDRLGYTDDEMKVFRENKRNEDVLSKAPELLDKTIVLEVVASHGCNSQHKVGDMFHLDGAGNLLTERCPKKVCIYAHQCGDLAGLRFERALLRRCRSERHAVQARRLRRCRGAVRRLGPDRP